MKYFLKRALQRNGVAQIIAVRGQQVKPSTSGQARRDQVCTRKFKLGWELPFAARQSYFSAGVMHDASDPVFSRRIGQNLEPAKVLSLHGGTGLYLDTHRLSRRVFQDNVYFLSRRRAPVIKLWLCLAPGRLLPHFHHNEVL